jgi:hypothetical protein
MLNALMSALQSFIDDESSLKFGAFQSGIIAASTTGERIFHLRCVDMLVAIK